MSTSEFEILQKEIKGLKSLITQLVDEKKKSVWVKVSTIQSKTGWNKNQLRAARDNNVIKFKREGRVIRYDLNSIPQNLLKTA